MGKKNKKKKKPVQAPNNESRKVQEVAPVESENKSTAAEAQKEEVQAQAQGPSLNDLLNSKGHSTMAIGRMADPLQQNPKYPEMAVMLERLTSSYLLSVDLISKSVGLSIDAKLFLMVSEEQSK